MTATADRIQTIWHWCCDAYLRRGHRLSFPRGTDPTKTYQWRYLEALERQFHTWDFDDALCRRFIDIAAAYATERGLIRKGLSIFFQRNLLRVCYDRLRADEDRHASILEALASSHAWLAEHGMGMGRQVDTLLERGGLGSYTNLTKWYQAGHITDLYLALSRACGIALARLANADGQERALLPKATKLVLVRAPLVRDPLLKARAREILQDDWRQMCP